MPDGNSGKMYRYFQANTLGRKTFADIRLYGYAESSSNRLITTKGTKKEGQYFLSFLRDLRALRGGITYDRIQLKLSR